AGGSTWPPATWATPAGTRPTWSSASVTSEGRQGCLKGGRRPQAMTPRTLAPRLRRTRAMREHHPRIRIIALGLLAAAVVALLLLGEGRPAQAFVLRQLPTLSEVCKEADEIAVLQVEKID